VRIPNNHWGWNYKNQLGNGTALEGTSTYPLQVKGVNGVGYLTDIVAIGGRGVASFSVALKHDGTVYAWGYNNDGQLGDGTTLTETFAPSSTVIFDKISHTLFSVKNEKLYRLSYSSPRLVRSRLALAWHTIS
jgi:alpha-tubulin suppressor-like RCC1 family protein